MQVWISTAVVEWWPSLPNFSVLLNCMIGLTAASTGYQKPSFLDFDSWWYHTPRGPQIFSCLTYLERNVRVDCEFPKSDKIPGPFCEFKQDGRLMGTTNPNNPVHLIPPIETRRRTNITLVPPNICRLTWMPMSDDRAYAYTCRVYQGSTWKENSMSFTQRECSVYKYFNYFAYLCMWKKKHLWQWAKLKWGNCILSDSTSFCSFLRKSASLLRFEHSSACCTLDSFHCHLNSFLFGTAVNMIKSCSSTRKSSSIMGSSYGSNDNHIQKDNHTLVQHSCLCITCVSRVTSHYNHQLKKKKKNFSA